MKKYLLIVLLLIAIPVSGLTLWEFFGGKLPSIKERATLYYQYGFDDEYKGTAEQNTRFVGALVDSPLLGAAFSTLTSTDQLTAFPAVYNVNLGNSANTTTPNSWSGLQQFNGQASSTLFSCYGICYFGATATSTFSTAGALTLITPLLPASGGTGSSTLSSNQVLLGNGTGNITTVNGWGTTDQVLGSTGGTGAPTWRTFATDLTINYSWTGLHIFSASTTGKVGIGTTTPVQALGVQGNAYLSGTTTSAKLEIASSTIAVNGLTYKYPSAGMASSTSLVTDAGGGLTFGAPTWATGATSTNPGWTGNMVMTHGLGRTPVFIRITAYTKTDEGGTGAFGMSVGTATSTVSQFVISGAVISATANVLGVAQMTGNIIDIGDASMNSEFKGSITAIGATTFTLNIATNVSTGASDRRLILWETY